MPATITLIRTELPNLRIRRTHTTRNDSWQGPVEGVKATSSVKADDLAGWVSAETPRRIDSAASREHNGNIRAPQQDRSEA